jgi:hypothetical protein
MDASRTDPASDVEFLRELLARTRARVDPHGFHFVWWGAIVLLWFPLATWLQEQGQRTAMAVLGAGCLVLGGVGSAVLEGRLRGRSRLDGEDSAVGRRVGQIVAANIAAGFVLSALAPATGFVRGETVPLLWGLVYASLAFHVGMVYSREFVWGGAFLLLGTCAAMPLGDTAGYVLGPVMGLGMIVPGLVAERRVRRLRREDASDALAVS